MKIRGAGLASAARRLLLVAGMGALLALTGCASFYVDSSIKEVAATQYVKPQRPQPVQLLFEFQTKGALNTRATERLKAQVVEQVKDSGLFSQVQDQPVPGGGLLSITLNNVPISDDAFSKGFLTGLTFGLAGSQVADGYVCTAQYVEDGRTDASVAAARHAIYTKMGAGGQPANGIQAPSLEAAVRTMSRQVVSVVLKDLATDLGGRARGAP